MTKVSFEHNQKELAEKVEENWRLISRKRCSQAAMTTTRAAAATAAAVTTIRFNRPLDSMRLIEENETAFLTIKPNSRIACFVAWMKIEFSRNTHDSRTAARLSRRASDTASELESFRNVFKPAPFGNDSHRHVRWTQKRYWTTA